MSESWFVRPARPGDIGSLVALARALGPGMTTLPADDATIAAKVDSSIRTFADLPCDDRQYILVLEDGDTGRVLGLSGVYPRVGEAHGFFSYKLTRLVQRSIGLGRRYEIELLTLSNDYTGATEIGTLAVLPELRGTSAGRFLARARYMLIGAFPDRFSPRVMAEMRGWQDEGGESPFWNAIGARFFDMSFQEADHLSAVEGAGFIADLMPKQPIYTALLPDEARAVIGRAHAVSVRAMSMLLHEDFRYEAHVDVFDGGPQVHAMRDRIRTIEQTRLLEAKATTGEGDALMLVSNADLRDFRVVQTGGDAIGGTIGIAAPTLAALRLSPGEQARVAPGYRRA
jgi:arginine N-succinyltransferase